MKKLMLIALLALFASATTMPTLGKVFGTAAYAGQGQDNDDQGDDNDDQ